MMISEGIPDRDIDQAVSLYWDAFSKKLNFAMGPRAKGLRFVERVIRPDHAICAHSDAGVLLGVAGFKTYDGALVGGDFADMQAIYGLFSATWRALLLHTPERDIENERFLMDGLFVSPSARGQGVGTALLHAIISTAKARGYSEVRLDVIDTNPRAKGLYEREGFKAIKTQNLGLLKHVFGFASATTMVRPTIS